jgi:ribosomal protein S18 acetylase RimI-like enzyme
LFGKDCFDLVGVRPHEREAAIFLLEKFGIKKLRSAKAFIEEQNDDDFAYKVLTPYDLRIKWLGLKDKKDKS